MEENTNSNQGLMIGILVVSVLSFIFSGMVFFSLKGNMGNIGEEVKKAVVSIETEKVGGEENYTLLQKLLSSQQFKDSQKQGLEQTIQQLSAVAGINGIPEKNNNGTIAEPSGNKFLSQFETGQLEANILTELKANSYILGDEKADITWIEFSDLECPFCKKLHDSGVTETLIKDPAYKINYIFKHFPLNSIHSNAEASSLGLECIAEQSNSEMFYKALFNFFDKSIYKVDSMKDFITENSLDFDKVNKCVVNKTHLAKINNNLTEGQRLFNIQGTPGNVVVNNKTGKYVVISGAYPYEAFKEAVDFVK